MTVHDGKGLYCSKCKHIGNNCELLECPKCDTPLELITYSLSFEVE